MSEDLQQLLREVGSRIDAAETIAVSSHTRPDGDAIGSLVALGDALTRAGKKVVMLNQDHVPYRYKFLEGVENVKRPADLDEPLEVDVFVALDTADAKRVGSKVWKAIKSRKLMILIDHHVSNERYADINYVDVNSPATGQIVYELIRQQNWPLSSVARDHLWVAIVTDTGSFQYQNTTERTLEIAADLVREGVDVGRISTRIFQDYPYRRLVLLGELLSTLDRSECGRIASWKLKKETLDRLEIRPDDTEGLIDNLRSIDGVIVAVSFEEAGDEFIRISARSKSPEADVSKICGQFGGGGHQLAAGARQEGTLEEVSERFLAAVEEALPTIKSRVLVV
ncbi:MAG: phosphoesterase RecJ-like protein [Verrucomicrobiales bacterium]|jgi:phosphoesterase RecJ-like protein